MTTITQLESTTTEVDTLLYHAAVAPLDESGWLRVTGEDRVRWLNGMVTNSITSLTEGEGNYNFVLSAQGRIQGDLVAFAEPGALALKTARVQIPGLIALLDRFIIMDDVELADITSEYAGLSVSGPQASAVLQAIGLPVDGLTPIHKQTATWRGAFVVVLQEYSPLVPRYEVWAASEVIATLTEVLTQAGAFPCTSKALEHLRILEGTPRYGTDIRDRELPQETAQTRALHFAKGCYLGQEIVERIRSRGNVHRTFTGFRLHGALPAAGTSIEGDGKALGELTSVAALELSGETIQIALGYIRREALDRAVSLSYSGGQATPATLPFSVLQH